MLDIKRTLTTRDKDRIAAMLSTNREALEAFERSYAGCSFAESNDSFFGLSARGAKAQNKARFAPLTPEDEEKANGLAERITAELIYQRTLPSPEGPPVPVTRDEVLTIPEALRPQLTGSLMKVDIGEPPCMMLFYLAEKFVKETDPTQRAWLYGMFRNGMEVLDLDEYVYEMLGKNPNNMSYWFPALADACCWHGSFLIPQTNIVKVPLPILQLTRLDYSSLTPTTLKIVNDFCMRMFDLDVTKSYFVKTGVFSAKYDFRNAHVTGEKEVRELGEYLLYISNLAVQMMGPLNNPKGISSYGAACTNEWVVRQYIEDKENNPCIYHGMPLHTEYRVFIDCDKDEILGIAPYWNPDVMRGRFGNGADSNTPDMVHDYIIYTSHESTLMARYEANKELVLSRVREILPDIDLPGQWSLDIMQNGDDFYAIDMALAANSALNDCVPREKLAASPLDVREYLPQIAPSTKEKGE